MQKLQAITPKEYLTRNGVAFRETGKELITRCLFNSCDDDSTGTEAHLYFDAETGQYNCKKCGEKGNLITLGKHFGDTTPVQRKKTANFDTELVEKCHTALPAHVRDYLHKRGLTDAVIDTKKLGYGDFYGKKWVTIPIKNADGDFVFFKLRQNPAQGNEKMTYPKSTKLKPIEAQIYDWGIIKTDTRLMLCEGEMDRLLLISKGISAITSTHGAGTFKEEWVQKIGGGKKIFICFDNDEAGRRGAERVAKMALEADIETHLITLPEDVGDKGDITEYFIKLDGKVEDLFGKYAKKYVFDKTAERIRKVEKPKKETIFEEWRQTIQENFPELLFPSEIGLSIISQILIKEITNPFALVLVGAPSAGKTITINFFADIEGLTYASDKFTPASFVSNASNVKKEDLEKIDLLPRLKYNMLLLRDLATLFSKREDDLNECLGILTRVLDGEGLNTDSGVHGQRKYTGEHLFMILAASTPIQPRVWNAMGNLGSRLFFLNILSREKSNEELAEQLTSGAYKEKENACRTETKNFLHTLWNKYPNGVDWDNTLDSTEHKLIIVLCARFLARARGTVSISKESDPFSGEKYQVHEPLIERPDRLNQLFYNLARAHALVCGRMQIKQDDLRLVVELALDSSIRSKLIRMLLERNGVMKTSDIEADLKCSKPTALKEMEVLRALGICHITQESRGRVGEPEKELRLKKEFEWFISDECKRIRGQPPPTKQNTMEDLL